jgi:hypothetical protein
MRSFAIAALFGSAVACASLAGQSLTEHAAAAAGGTIGTAAGKPLGSALGRIFGNVDNTSSKAAGSKAAANTKTAKPLAQKPPSVAPAAKAEHTVTLGGAPGGSNAGGEGGAGSSHRSYARRREAIEAETPIPAPIAPLATEPVVRQPTTQELGSIKVGTAASELGSMLGTPESKVSIPDDDGHLRETLQYWANGEEIGTVHLDNGRVVSVQTSR